MISGDYEIISQKTVYDEKTVHLELCIVTWEIGDKPFNKFEEELKALLDKYAI